jgi:hypothetical protein
MKAPTHEKPREVELEPDAWARFERAVDTVSKSGPQHRARGATPSQRTGKEALWGVDWQEWGFDSEPAIVAEPLEGSLSRPVANQSGRRVVSWMREIEGGIELSFDPPA